MKWDSAIVLTTIRVPYLIKSYVDNLSTYSHVNAGIVIIGDQKTPEKAVEKIVDKTNVRANDKIEVEFWSLQKQSNWLRNYPKISKIIPHNSDNRRNLGFLIAAEKGTETIISIDDDNYATKMDFLGCHSIVGKTCTMKTVRSKNNWYNPCRLLIKRPRRELYPRGFPVNRRWKDVNKYIQSNGKIMMNMGLWLGDPDADAITNLVQPTRICGIKGESLMLAPGTFAPINTQNTAFHREVLPSYYYIKMGFNLCGLRLDRYGDIWSGLFAKKVLDKMNHRVSIGFPLTEHRRNKHDLFSDLQAELWGMIVTEKLADWIENIDLSGRSYSEAYLSLASELKSFCPDMGNSVSEKIAEYFEEISACMETWVETCNIVL